MGISEREHHIKALENLLSHYKSREKCEGYYDRTLKDSVEALHYAISSIKTDLKYDLMYEEEEVYTKADMVDMLKEIQLKIEEKSYYDTTIIGNYEDEVRIDLVELDDVNDIIQKKINELKGKQEGKE